MRRGTPATAGGVMQGARGHRSGARDHLARPLQKAHGAPPGIFRDAPQAVWPYLALVGPMGPFPSKGCAFGARQTWPSLRSFHAPLEMLPRREPLEKRMLRAILAIAPNADYS